MAVNRRAFLTLGLGLASYPAAAGPASPLSAAAFSFATERGSEIRLADFTGRPVLVVNTASLCGFTPQYVGLQQLWTRFRDRGLIVLGVPSDDFGGQEPGTPDEIEATAHTYGVTFPLVAKVAVTGPKAHPFYKWAATERPGERPSWNFHKYLVGCEGHIAAVFASAVEPTDTRIIAAIVRELNAAVSN